MALRGDILPLKSPMAAEIDTGLKNRWRWDWLEAEHEGDKISRFFEKLKIAGKAYCKLCRCEIAYKSTGKRALFDHLKGKQHNEKVKTSNDNFRLSGKPEGNIAS